MLIKISQGIPKELTRPDVGLKPEIPQKFDGVRILPAISVPKPSKQALPPINAPSPEEDPPDDSFRFKGFFVLP